VQSLFESIHTFQQRFQHVGLWTALLGNCVCWFCVKLGSYDRLNVAWLTINTRALEHLASLAAWSQAITFDLE
jgi:hypothetical protein